LDVLKQHLFGETVITKPECLSVNFILESIGHKNRHWKMCFKTSNL